MAVLARALVLFLVLNGVALARREDDGSQRRQMFRDLKPREPRVEMESEGGKVEVWGGRGSGAFEDANVAACRTTLRNRALWLPSYVDSPTLHIVTRGCGRVGIISPSGDRRTQENTFKVEKGDVVAAPKGVVLWWYNGEQRDMEIVGAADVSESTRPAGMRAFTLAGGRGMERQRGGEQRRREDEEQESREGEGESEQSGYRSVMHGFSREVLARAWEMDRSAVDELLQSQTETRIVRLDRDIKFPDADAEECRENAYRQNYIYRLARVNPDVRVPNGGEIRELNSFRHPVLKGMRLGMECVQLRENAMVSPNWFRNAHQVVYVVQGRGRIQAVRDNGEKALDTNVEEGSLLVIPALHPSTKMASSQGLHYVSFVTSDRPSISYLSGRNSVYRNIPLRVLSRMLNVDEDRASQIQRAHERESVIFPEMRSEEEEEEEARHPRREGEGRRRKGAWALL